MIPPKSTPPFQNISPFSTTRLIMRRSQNLPLPPRKYPPPFQQLYATLPESTPPSQNTPPFFNNYNITGPSQNLPLPPRIYSPFQQIYMCDPPRLYSSLPEYALPI